MKWNLDALAAAPEETRGLNTPADGIYELSAFHAVPEKWRFSPMGECGQVPFRGGVVRFVFFKLFGTGIVALLCAARAADRKASFGCALSAAVNAVACAHYYLVVRTQSPHCPYVFAHFPCAIADLAGPDANVSTIAASIRGTDWQPCQRRQGRRRAHSHPRIRG
jgi:hypothetical protein